MRFAERRDRFGLGDLEMLREHPDEVFVEQEPLVGGRAGHGGLEQECDGLVALPYGPERPPHLQAARQTARQGGQRIPAQHSLGIALGEVVVVRLQQGGEFAVESGPFEGLGAKQRGESGMLLAHDYLNAVPERLADFVSDQRMHAVALLEPLDEASSSQLRGATVRRPLRE